jgi:epoxyqueuosine reductase
MTIQTVYSAVARTGLVPRGALLLAESERTGALAGLRTIALAGMAGRDGWDAFAASPEASDGLGHPLDRWSRRLIEALARELGAKAFFRPSGLSSNGRAAPSPSIPRRSES